MIIHDKYTDFLLWRMEEPVPYRFSMTTLYSPCGSPVIR
jgi:hypothetical protein